MLIEYINKAMSKAVYEKLEDGSYAAGFRVIEFDFGHEIVQVIYARPIRLEAGGNVELEAK